MGRWASRDPIEEWGGWNIACLLANDPVNDVDVFGEQRYKGSYPRPTPPRIPRSRPQPPRSPGDPTPIPNPGSPPENWGQAIFNICIQMFVPDAIENQRKFNELLGEMQKASARIPCGETRCVIIIIDGVVDDPVDNDTGVILPPGRAVYKFNISGTMGSDKNKKCCNLSSSTSLPRCCPGKKEQQSCSICR